MGGKSGGQTVGFRYYLSMHMGLSRGPIDELVQIMAGDLPMWPIPDSTGESSTSGGDLGGDVVDSNVYADSLVCIAQGPNTTGIKQYSNGSYLAVGAEEINTISASGDYEIAAGNLFGGDKKEGGIAGSLRAMMGDVTQTVPTWIKELMGGRVPGFRGVSTLFFDGLLCSLNPYPKKWEFRVRRTENGWDGDVWQPSLVTIWMRGGTIKAMNPAHMIYECLTNRDWGRGMSRDSLHDPSWLYSAQSLYNENFGLCMRYNRQSELNDFIQNILDYIGGSIYPDRSTGRLALDLLRSDYDVDDLPLFTFDSGLIDCEDSETSSQDDIISESIVKWFDPIRKEERSSRVQNIAANQAMGAPNSTTASYAGIPTVDLSLRVAQRDVKASAMALKRFKLTLDRRAWKIAPGKPFRITVPDRGIHNLVLRAGRVKEAGGTDGRITVEAVLDVFGLPESSFVSAQTSMWRPPSRKPQIADKRIVREPTYAELVAVMSPLELAALAPTAGTIATVAAKPTSLHQSYSVSTLVTGETERTIGPGSFAPYVIADAAISPTDVVIPVSGGMDVGTIVVGMTVHIDDEICRLDDIVYDTTTRTGTITIARGCIDTVPQTHLVDSTIFFSANQVGGDGREYAAGETVGVKILTFTSSGVLSELTAPEDDVGIVGRQGRPYPPGMVKVNDIHFASVTEQMGDLVLTWVHRDRKIQQDQLIDHSMSSVGPEAGTTYTVRVYNGNTASLVRTSSGITGTTYTYTPAMATDDLISADIWFELESVRDGYVSFSKYRFGVPIPIGYGTSGYGDNYGE